MKSFFAAVVCLILVTQTQGQLFGTNPTCSYQFTVPDTKGACSTTGSALDKKVDQVKQDLDKTRLQYVSQNSVVQGTLARVQADTNAYASKVNDLNNELQRLKQAISSGTPQNVNQMASTTKDLLTKAVMDINNKIYNLTYQFQRNAVEESKVNSAIQAQINQQAVKMVKTEQQLINLENMLKTVQANAGKPSAPLGTGGSGASSAQVNQLAQQYQTLQSDVQKIDQKHQSQFQGLNGKVNQLFAQTLNQSHAIDTNRMATTSILGRLQSAESDVKTTKDDLDKFQKKVEPQITTMSRDVLEMKNNVSRVELDLQQLGMRLLNGQATSMADHKIISTLQTSAQKLDSQVNALANQTTSQAGELIKLTGELNKLMNLPGSGGNATVTSLANALKTFQTATSAQLTQTNHTIAALQKQIVALLTQITPLIAHGGSG